jgi:hypothetical protein
MSWARARRAAAQLALLAVALVAAACDPGYSVSAVNRSDTPVVVREGTGKWLLPAHTSGLIFSTLGPPEDAPPIDYEILDAADCHLLATQHVDFSKDADASIVVGPDAAIALGSPDPSMESMLAMTDACPGPDDGWSLFIVNETVKALYIRSRGPAETIVAAVDPSSSAIALGGHDETTTIELLDAQCRVLDSHIRKGWGSFMGTIAGSKLTIGPSKAPPDDALSYAYTGACNG